MSKLTAKEIESSKIAAREAAAADRRHDTVARDAAMRKLWDVAGYWLTPRGDVIPPKMIRMPSGRSLPWRTGAWKAVEAWAEA